MVIVWGAMTPVYEGRSDGDQKVLMTLPNPAMIVIGDVPQRGAVRFYFTVRELSREFREKTTHNL